MNRIDALFADLRREGRKALMPFITAGDPSLPATEAILLAVQRAGASIVEVGIPFSDPIADGPVIQASMKHALDHGVKVHQVFESIQRVRADVEAGLVAMVSYTLVHRLGLTRFISEAKAAGFDGFIFPDLPIEEADEARAATAEAGLILSMLVAPSTPIDRAERIAAASTGFVYVVSRAGITGASGTLPEGLPERLTRLRGVTEAPITVGFGIARAEQVAQVVSVADAAIVGSALVEQIAQTRGADPSESARVASAMVGSLAQGLNLSGPAPV